MADIGLVIIALLLIIIVQNFLALRRASKVVRTNADWLKFVVRREQDFLFSERALEVYKSYEINDQIRDLDRLKESLYG